MDHPRAGLRYVDADDLDDTSFDFDGLNVESNTGDKLGDVDGFIIDINAARPYYVVVNAGGWFSSKYFLLPIGHVGLDTAGHKLIADVPRDRVEKFPGFDRDEFDKLTDEDLNRMDTQTIGACCPNETIDASSSSQRYDRWTHYRHPTWWDASYYRPDRADTAARTMVSMGSSASSMPREEIRAKADRDVMDRKDASPAAAGGDVSPHFGGRAQPGDVLGVETGGERTYVGDSTDEENERRQKAEKEAAEQKRR